MHTSIIAGACRCSPSAAFAGKSSRPRPPVSSPGLSCSMPRTCRKKRCGRICARLRGRKQTTSRPRRFTRCSTPSTASILAVEARSMASRSTWRKASAPLFIDAGHILGSASILLELTEVGRRLSLLFSGDLGNAGRPLLRPPATPPHADIVVIETTYGERLHKPMNASMDELYGAIADTFNRGGNVIIPTFALERAQELLWILNQGIAKKRLTRSTQVFLDSPMAISAAEIFRHHPECLEPEAAR